MSVQRHHDSGTWKDRQRLGREETILNAARLLIAKNGYEAMTMEGLAAKAGVSKPTLYQHFPSKEALAVRAVVESLKRSAERLSFVGADQAPIDRLSGFVRWLMTERFRLDDVVFSGGRFSLIDLVRTHPEHRIARRQLIDRLSVVVDAAKASGAVRDDLSTRTLIELLFSLVRDTDYEQMIADNEATAFEIAETVCTVYLAGIRKTD